MDIQPQIFKIKYMSYQAGKLEMIQRCAVYQMRITAYTAKQRGPKSISDQLEDQRRKRYTLSGSIMVAPETYRDKGTMAKAVIGRDLLVKLSVIIADNIYFEAFVFFPKIFMPGLKERQLSATVK